jgi:hypothetical protein
MKETKWSWGADSIPGKAMAITISFDTPMFSQQTQLMGLNMMKRDVSLTGLRCLGE